MSGSSQALAVMDPDPNLRRLVKQLTAVTLPRMITALVL